MGPEQGSSKSAALSRAVTSMASSLCMRTSGVLPSICNDSGAIRLIFIIDQLDLMLGAKDDLHRHIQPATRARQMKRYRRAVPSAQFTAPAKPVSDSRAA